MTTASLSGQLLASYEAVPYEGTAVTATHPDVLATAARLRGMTPPDLARCRVLEIGCSTGGNIAAMALAMPDASFVGIDLSPSHIAAARATADALALDRVHFEAMSVADVGESFGTFDYILSHGVYSWVPRDVQEALLRVCSRHLAPHGLAYVSYNTYPGWHLRGIIRDMLTFHDRPELPPDERVARGRRLVEFVYNAASPKEEAYRAVLAEELHTLRGTNDSYFLHEELEATNEAVYFTEFARRAAEAGLQYVCEAQPSTADVQLASESRDVMRDWSASRVAYEQYLDYVLNRTFRRTILCHRGIALHAEPSADALPEMFFGIRALPDPAAPDAKQPGVEVFRTGGVAVTMNHPVVLGVLHVLLDARPAWLSFSDLLDGTRSRVLGSGGPPVTSELVADILLWCAIARLIEPHLRRAPGATTIAECPTASPLARRQAQGSAMVSTLRHGNVDLAPFDRLVLLTTDGEHDIEAVTDVVSAAFARGELEVDEQVGTAREALTKAVRRSWQQFLTASLLMP